MRGRKYYLSKREQEIMESLFSHGPMTANELMLKLAGSPSNSSVRTQLRILEQKGVVSHDVVDGAFVFRPTEAREQAAESALSNVVKTFFQGSISQTVASLISQNESSLTDDELAEIEALIAKAKEEGR
ncbi:MAG: BlaI/MecI/CopY family transcriptional regulator [Armatimonadetes bacterium]|nr:BlaI/MecI/CopY family transcriptional regulator [Armatimonadota bacterium]